MKHTALFRFLSMLTVLFYSIPLAYSGQIITQSQRSWAKDAIKQETSLGVVSSPNSIAVVYFNNKSGIDRLNVLQKGMAVMLITDLSKIKEFQVVERVWLQALLDEMDLGASGLMDAKTIPNVGNLLGAYYVISGEIAAESAQNIEIGSSILDIPLKTVTQQPTAAGQLDELFKIEKRVLFNIVKQMNVTISPEKRAELEIPLSASTPALLALFAGIDHSDKGQYTKAAQMYEQALIEDPNLSVAQSALQELEGMGLVSTEEVTATIAESTPESAAVVEEEGSSVGIIVGVGLALAAGVGAAIALSGSSGSDSPPAALPPNGNQTDPTVVANPASGSILSCSQASVDFSFSKPMDTSYGVANISPTDFASGAWSSSQLYSVSWSSASTYCTTTSLSITLSGFKDTTGQPLSGATKFTYPLE